MTSAAAPYIGDNFGAFDGAVVSSLIGGTVSELSGGDFANGAISSSFAFAVNHCSTDGNCSFGFFDGEREFFQHVKDALLGVADESKRVGVEVLNRSGTASAGYLQVASLGTFDNILDYYGIDISWAIEAYPGSYRAGQYAAMAQFGYGLAKLGIGIAKNPEFSGRVMGAAMELSSEAHVIRNVMRQVDHPRDAAGYVVPATRSDLPERVITRPPTHIEGPPGG